MTAYEMRISDWSSDVCSSDLLRSDGEERGHGRGRALVDVRRPHVERHRRYLEREAGGDEDDADDDADRRPGARREDLSEAVEARGSGEAVDQRGAVEKHARGERAQYEVLQPRLGRLQRVAAERGQHVEREALQFQAQLQRRSEEHTSELQSIMRISYAVF